MGSGGLGCISGTREVWGLICGENGSKIEFSGILLCFDSTYEITSPKNSKKTSFSVFSSTLRGSRSKFRVETEICYGARR